MVFGKLTRAAAAMLRARRWARVEAPGNCSEESSGWAGSTTISSSSVEGSIPSAAAGAGSGCVSLGCLVGTSIGWSASDSLITVKWVRTEPASRYGSKGSKLAGVSPLVSASNCLGSCATLHCYRGRSPASLHINVLSSRGHITGRGRSPAIRFWAGDNNLELGHECRGFLVRYWRWLDTQLFCLDRGAKTHTRFSAWSVRHNSRRTHFPSGGSRFRTPPSRLVCQ